MQIDINMQISICSIYGEMRMPNIITNWKAHSFCCVCVLFDFVLAKKEKKLIISALLFSHVAHLLCVSPAPKKLIP